MNDMTPILELLIFWAAGMLTTATVLNSWFNTSLPIEIFTLLLRFGWREEDQDEPGPDAFWDQEPDEMTRKDFDAWLIQKDVSGQLSHFAVKLMTCPGCASVHVSYLVCCIALLLWLPMGFSPHTLFLLFVAAPATWPPLALKLISK